MYQVYPVRILGAGKTAIGMMGEGVGFHNLSVFKKLTPLRNSTRSDILS